MLSGVHLIRRRLLEMYTTLNKNGIFRASRERSRKVCKPFDRGEYLDCIVKQTRVASIPLEFEIWIQEWPDSAAFDCIWPGLPLDWSEEDVSIRRHGWNLLSHQPPQLYEVYTDRGQAVPALPIWEDYGAKPGYWLILDQKAETYGRVVTLRRTYKVHCYTKEEIDLSTFQMSYRRAPTDEDREQHASERYGLSFLDWLQVALDRYCLGLRDCAEARQYFDKDAQIWRPKIDHNHLNDMPTYRTGGHLMRFTPWRRRAVAPLVSLPSGPGIFRQF